MTVKELIAQLQQFEPDAPVSSVWDSCDMPIAGVVNYKGRAVIDCENRTPDDCYTAADLEAFGFRSSDWTWDYTTSAWTRTGQAFDD